MMPGRHSTIRTMDPTLLGGFTDDRPHLVIHDRPEGLVVLTEPGFAHCVTDGEIEAILELERVMCVHLYQTQISDGMLARIIDRHKETLNVLRVNATAISDGGLSGIGQCKRLELISASSTKITDRTLEELAKMSTLREVVVNETAVTHRGVEAFAGHPRLEVLCLVDCRLPDQVLDTFGQIPKLRAVLLAGNAVSPKAVHRFQAAHPGVTLGFARSPE